MKPRRGLAVIASALIGACTYNEYNNTYNDVRVADAGVGSVAGASGGGSGGANGAQAGAAGASGAAGSTDVSGAGAAGASSVTNAECTGCLRLTFTPNARRNLSLELPTSVDLSRSQITWRVRVRDTGDAYLAFYAQSGDAPEDTFFLANLSLNSAAGWPYVGADLSNVPDFAPPNAPDSGVAGGAGAGFDMGFPFDKTRVKRVGIFIQPNVPSGILTPLTIEIDSLTFSDHPSLDVSFASNDGGLRLIESDGASLAGATLEQIDE